VRGVPTGIATSIPWWNVAFPVMGWRGLGP